MDIRFHPVGMTRHLQRIHDPLPIHPGIEAHGLAAVEKAIHVIVEERPDAIVKAHPLPHAVAQHEAAVIDRDHGLVPVLERTIDVDADIGVARILQRVMGGDHVRSPYW